MRSTPLNRFVLWFCAIVSVSLCISALTCRDFSSAGDQAQKSNIKKQIVELARFGELCTRFKTSVGFWPTNADMITVALGVTNRTELYDVWGHPYGFYPA